MLALLDWNVQLGRSSEVIDNILTRIRESTEAPQRVIGVQFLAALDGAPFLLEFLGDRQNHEVRGAARYALQVWLLRRIVSMISGDQNGNVEAVEKILDRLVKTPNNAEFLASLSRAGV